MQDLTPYQDYVVLVRKFPKCLQEFTHPVQSAGQHFVSSITFVPLDKLMSGVINLGFLHSDLRITINTFLSRCMQKDKGLVQSVRLAAVGVTVCKQRSISLRNMRNAIGASEVLCTKARRVPRPKLNGFGR